MIARVRAALSNVLDKLKLKRENSNALSAEAFRLVILEWIHDVAVSTVKVDI